MALSWKTKAAHPSKPSSTLVARAYTMRGQADSTLYTIVVHQVYQAKLLHAIDVSGPDPAAFKELCSMTDLVLRATKSTAQAFSCAMTNLVVLKRHLWLNRDQGC